MNKKLDKKNKTPLGEYQSMIEARTKEYAGSKELNEMRLKLHEYLAKTQYVHSFFWLGRPILQLPQDMQAMQEIIWAVKPDLIIETGIAWGGSLIFSASILVLLEACKEIKKGDVIGIDIEIRPHNKKALAEHPLSKKIRLFEGSSIDPSIVKQVVALAKKKKRVLVCLDSNHTRKHVLRELEAYAPLVSKGSYCIVGDTMIDEVPGGTIAGRPWVANDNPKTAVKEFLKANKDFRIDKNIESKVIMTGSPDGYLRRIK